MGVPLVPHITFVNIYRPPQSILEVLYSELSDLLNVLPSSAILLGDVNCPGSSPSSVDARLDTTLSIYNMSVVDTGPTRLNPSNGSASRLDIIAESDNIWRLHDLSTVQIGYSDHQLIRFWSSSFDSTVVDTAVV